MFTGNNFLSRNDYSSLSFIQLAKQMRGRMPLLNLLHFLTFCVHLEFLTEDNICNDLILAIISKSFCNPRLQNTAESKVRA